MPQDFINGFGDKQFLTTKLYMLEEEGRFAGEVLGQVNIGEQEALRRVIEQYKEYKKNMLKRLKKRRNKERVFLKLIQNYKLKAMTIKC